MKNIYLVATLMLACMSLKAQSRKYAASFPLYKQYYNPALTGFEGSAVNALYRSQWSSLEGAPSTFYLSAELGLSDLMQQREADQQEESKGRMDKVPYARHAFGLSFLNDTFGPYYEHQLSMSYSSSLKITQALSLRAGTTLAYHLEGLDGNRMNLEQSSDPFVLQYMQHARNGRLDINLGLMLAGEKFYLGYALHDAAKGGGKLNKETEIITYAYKHIVQGGYRVMLSEQTGLVAQALYQYDQQRGGMVEGQLKTVFCNKVWVGAGYRNQLAYSFNLGLQLHNLKIGYAFEVPTGEAQLTKETSELMLSYQFGGTKGKVSGIGLSIW